jgi:hypothetical protein
VVASGKDRMAFFAAATVVIGIIPDALTQLPLVGGYVTPAISAAITMAALAGEHQLAVIWGYNTPAPTAGTPIAPTALSS